MSNGRQRKGLYSVPGWLIKVVLAVLIGTTIAVSLSGIGETGDNLKNDISDAGNAVTSSLGGIDMPLVDWGSDDSEGGGIGCSADPDAKLYSGPNFDGDCRGVNAGDSLPDLGDFDVFSVMVKDGYTVDIFTKTNLREGDGVMRIGGNSHATYFNDRTESVELEDGCSVTLYEDGSQNGASLTCTAENGDCQCDPENNPSGPCSNLNKVDYGAVEDWGEGVTAEGRVSSADVQDGCTATLWTKPNQDGQSLALYGVTTKMGMMGQTNSVQVKDASSGETTADDTDLPDGVQ